MKRLIAVMICIITVAGMFSPALCYGAGEKDSVPLSLALQIISSKEPMVKSVVSENITKFSVKDFSVALGKDDFKYLVITELPAFSTGQLYLGELPVSIGQKITYSSLDDLTFVPNNNVKESSFSFRADDCEYNKECKLYFLDSINYSPVSNGCDESFFTVTTFKNIKVCGRMVIDDPENDDIRYEIVAYPQNGLLKLLDRTSGDYEYTPIKNYIGDDSFSYRAIDKYGNRSAVIKVNVEVKRSKYGRVFTDMVNSAEHYGAILLSDKNIMPTFKTAEGLSFMPEVEVTKGEFILYAMKALDIEPDNDYTDVIMADIPNEYRPYVNAANKIGAIYEDIDKFDYSGYITRSEACYILDSLMNIGVMKSEMVFADAEQIPEYAYDSLQTMAQMNILPVSFGKAEPDKLLDRAECARILSLLLMRK